MAASRCIVGETWVYVSAACFTEACPSISETSISCSLYSYTSQGGRLHGFRLCCVTRHPRGQRFPDPGEVRRPQGAVVEPVPRFADLAPDHPSVVRAHRAGKADVTVGLQYLHHV